jgi:hypothetical protein
MTGEETRKRKGQKKTKTKLKKSGFVCGSLDE